jgi:thymidylate synthase
MDEYHQTILDALTTGTHEKNRTAEDTIATFGNHYSIDLSEGYPLLTTKEMDTFRWDSLLHEFEWYLGGEHHVKDLTNKTGIWDAWADEEHNLPSAYGRFWRRYPVPNQSSQLQGEAWVSEDSKYTTREENDELTFDQLGFVVDALSGDNPHRGPESRRLIVNAWHPANAQVSGLPPCHYTFVFNTQNGKLNTHLTQRSADIALGVPFNIAAYSLMTKLIAQQTGYEVGEFSHTLVDAHIYCGRGERSEWYSKNLSELQERVENAESREEYKDIRNWILDSAPEDEGASDVDEHKYGYDHVPGLLEQLSREPLGRSNLDISDGTTIDNISYDDFSLEDYDSYDGISFKVAE